jgi:O-antigen/teichoic acid export membrane protein
VNPAESTLRDAPPTAGASPVTNDPRAELKRGAVINTIALLASNFRGIFTFLVARLLGPAVLGTFSVAWASLELTSKIAVFGLDNAITTFVARAEAVGDHARSRALFRIAVVIALVQSVVISAIVIAAIQLFGDRLSLPREMLSAFAFILGALPGVALYRVGTSVSWGMKVMKHDIFSRGITESVATTLAFLIAVAIGFNKFAPEVAAISGTTCCGMVAFLLAANLFQGTPSQIRAISIRDEAAKLLAYGAPISAHQLLNALIYRLDVIMLGFFVGRAPGVTLATVGVYGAALEVAGGLRKVNQAFNPIFTPIIAGMTHTGDHERAAATYARLAQWMLWILMPLIAIMLLAGSAILLIYGPAFQQGAAWLAVVAFGCATNSYVSFGETIIMVQRPRLNLVHSIITCAVAALANLLLIPRFGAMGAACGLLIAYLTQGLLRFIALRFVFKWRNPWTNLAPPLIAAVIAFLPAWLARVLFGGIVGQITAAILFVGIFGLEWKFYSRLEAFSLSSRATCPP